MPELIERRIEQHVYFNQDVTRIAARYRIPEGTLFVWVEIRDELLAQPGREQLEYEKQDEYAQWAAQHLDQVPAYQKEWLTWI